MNGAAGIRGYLLQTIICLTNSLAEDSDWKQLQIEPDHPHEKVDAVWHYSDDQTRVVQVKSSEDQIGAPKVRRWAGALEDSYKDAKLCELILIGPCAQTVCNLHTVGRVTIPTPLSLNVVTLIHEAAHLLARYREKKGLPESRASIREVVAKAIVCEFEHWSAERRRVTRDDFEKLFNGWIDGTITRELQQLEPLKKRIETHCQMLDSEQIRALYSRPPGLQGVARHGERSISDKSTPSPALSGSNYTRIYLGTHRTDRQTTPKNNEQDSRMPATRLMGYCCPQPRDLMKCLKTR